MTTLQEYLNQQKHGGSMAEATNFHSLKTKRALFLQNGENVKRKCLIVGDFPSFLKNYHACS